MRRYRNAKIVATLGPASLDPKIIEALFKKGADIFRLNFSHGTRADHARTIKSIRDLEKRYDRPICILTDLQGPKLRLGTFIDGSVTLRTGDRYRLDLEDKPGDRKRAPLPHPEVFACLSPKQELLLDDGKVRLRVITCTKTYAETRVITGGELSDRKGVNVPNTVLPVASMTEKDIKDLRFGLKCGVDWIGLSFIQKPEDVALARKLVKGRALLIAKLEKPSAIKHLDEIIELSDAVMVARGDLGVEMAPEEVPVMQKLVVRACRQAGKPVVVATQMLESMIHAPAPTRAEASDVATAVYDGADAVMLSAETATGDYPVESVAMMDRIIKQVENDPYYRRLMDADHPAPESTVPDAITAAARQAAHTISAAAIVTFTMSGSTTLRAARERPDVPIICLTANLNTARRVVMAWGVHAVHTADVKTFPDMVSKAVRASHEQGFAKRGQQLVVTAGVPFGTKGATNILRVTRVDY